MDAWINIAILVTIGIFFISGMRRGLIRQMMDVVGIIVAFVGGFYFAHYLALYLEQHLSLNYKISLAVSAIAIFVGIIVLFRFFGLVLQKFANITLLGAVDRLGGGIFGLFKGALLVSLILVLIFSLPFPNDFKDTLNNNRLSSALYPVLPGVFDFVLKHTPGGLDFDKNILRERRVPGFQHKPAADEV